jgi:hypothetical protein
MSYTYYQDYLDPSKYSVLDDSNNEWRGVITRTKDWKWESENGKIFDTRTEAANDNAPGSPPLRQAVIRSHR